eukprot:Awhi_evm1s6710
MNLEVEKETVDNGNANGIRRCINYCFDWDHNHNQKFDPMTLVKGDIYNDDSNCDLEW